MKKIAAAFCLMFLVLSGMASGPVPVLCLVSEDTAQQGLDSIDPEAASLYRKHGWDLHFGFYQKTTFDELMRYPVVVGMIPQLHAGTQAISPQLAEAFDKYMRSGGGLVMIPGPSYYTADDFERRVNPFLEKYGVGVRNDIPVDSNPVNMLKQVRALEYRYLRTSNLDRNHPVTKGIPFLLLPLDFSSNYLRTYTMTHPSKEWTVLASGEKTCGSFKRKSVVSGAPEPGEWKSEPPFLAVRPVGRGFLALFTTASRWYIYDACHWAFGSGFVLKEGNGLELMTRLFDFVSSHRDELPKLPPEKILVKAEPVHGNLPVIQDRVQWFDEVSGRLAKEGFGVVCRRNAGGIADTEYSAGRGFGFVGSPGSSWIVRRVWLDIFHPTAASGRACDIRDFDYRFDNMTPGGEYRLGVLVWSTQKEGARDLEIKWRGADDRLHSLKTVPLPRFDLAQGPRFEVVSLPPDAVKDGTLRINFSRGQGGEGTFTLVSEVWIFQKGAKRIPSSEFAAFWDSPAFGTVFQPEPRTWRKGIAVTCPDGKSPAEFATGASAAGLDFIAVSRRLETFGNDSFKNFSEECLKSGGRSIQGVPGIVLTASESGRPVPERPQRSAPIQACFAGPISVVPEKHELSSPHKLFWKFFGGEYSGGIRTAAVLMRPVSGGLSPYFQRFWRGFNLGEKGGIELYKELTADGYGPKPGFFMPAASPEDVKRIASSAFMQVPVPPDEKTWPFLYAACASTGPVIRNVSFSSDLMRDGEPGNGDVFRKSLWSVASISVESKSLLTELSLYDGRRLLRRFFPNRNVVSVSEPVLIDRQSSLFWIVRAADGSFAVTGSYSFIDERMRSNMCADNQNSICSIGRAPETFIRDERELYLQHSYWHTGEAQGQLGVMRDARNLVPRVIETGIVQLCKYVQPMPVIEFADGKTENHIFSRMSIAAASGEANRIHYEFEMPECSFRSSADITAFRPRDGGDTSILVELSLAAQRNIAPEEIGAIRVFSAGLMPSFPASWNYRVETKRGVFAEGILSSRKVPVEHPLAPFGIAALTPNNLAEPVLISLNTEDLLMRFDNLSDWNCRERLSVMLPKRGWEKGETRRYSFIFQLLQTPVDSVQTLSSLKGDRLYRASAAGKVMQGVLAGSRFVLDFKAADRAAVWRHEGWIGRDPLPVRISGLNPNWSAVLACGSEINPLPVDEYGTAMYSLDEKHPCNVAAGNPVVSDDPELRIEFAGISSHGVSMHLHNASNQRKTFRLRSNAAFHGVIPDFNFKISLNPGSGMWIAADSGRMTIDNFQ